MSTLDQDVHLLFSAIERAVTKFVKDELSDSKFWIESVFAEASDKLKKDPRSTIGDRNFIDYLYFQQKLEAISKYSSELQMTPIGYAIVQNLNDLFKLTGIRNDVAHPKPFQQEDLIFVKALAKSLVHGGVGEGEISEVMSAVHSQSGSNLEVSQILSSRVLNNLPAREYDDTGFIGRNKLIGQVVKDLKSKSNLNSFIWLTGLGGFGKTAIAREVANRLLLDEDQSFDVILWLNFKTHELSANGIDKIRDAVISASDLIQDFPLLLSEREKSLSELFEELGQLETLIIFDNCETYPGEINEIVDANPPNSVKFLFTSRRTGEFGRSIPIERMEFEECRYLLTRLSKAYPSNEIVELVKNPNSFATVIQLIGTSPLSIKWLARACNSGKSMDDVLAGRENLLKYCVENVYLGLTEEAKQVLNYLQISNSPLSIGDLSILMNKIEPNSLMQYISDLSRVGLVNFTTTEYRKVYVVDDIARDFLLTTNQISDDERKLFLKTLLGMRKKKTKRSKMRSSILREPYSPYVIDAEHIEPLVAVALQELLVVKTKQRLSSDALVARGKQYVDSAPKYWETYRVLGEIYSWFGEITKSIEYIEQAISVCPDAESLSQSRLHFFLSLKLLKTDENRAAQVAEMAVQFNECSETLLAHARCLTYLSEHDKASSLLEKALNLAESQTTVFHIAWAMFINLRRSCEELKGEALFVAARKALDFYFATSVLMLDCPIRHQDEVLGDVVNSLEILCQSFLLGLNVSGTNQPEFVVGQFVNRIHEVMTALQRPNWLSDERSRKYGLLADLSRILEYVPSIAPNVASEIREVIRMGESVILADSGQPIILIARTITWKEEIYGFAYSNLNGVQIPIWIGKKNLLNPVDASKIYVNTRVSGQLFRNEKGYLLKGISILDDASTVSETILS